MSIELKNVSYTYLPGTPYARQALKHVSLSIEEGSFSALAGHTGSGKSTLLQHLNGLISPTAGTVLVDGVNLAAHTKAEKKTALAARRQVGMVFQYAEQQLFEETIYADVAFGPRNFGLSDKEVETRVRAALAEVHLDFATYRDRSPFALSGGQMRRVALAGVLALAPKYLVLDEPTAGLDPKGRRELLQTIRELHHEHGTTIIFVSHNMDDIFALADEVAVLRRGELLLRGTPAEIFVEKETLASAGLRQPQLMAFLAGLRAAGLPLSAADELSRTPREAARAIARAMREKGGTAHAE